MAQMLQDKGSQRPCGSGQEGVLGWTSSGHICICIQGVSNKGPCHPFRRKPRNATRDSRSSQPRWLPGQVVPVPLFPLVFPRLYLHLPRPRSFSSKSPADTHTLLGGLWDFTGGGRDREELQILGPSLHPCWGQETPGELGVTRAGPQAESL